jgi:creatinine amidohydrolase
VDLAGFSEISPKKVRTLVGDGSFGGAYERSDSEIMAIWTVAVEETRAVLESGW